MLWNYKGHEYSSIGRTASRNDSMGILARIDKFIQVDHGPVENKTQLFLTKYAIWNCGVSNTCVVAILILFHPISDYGDLGTMLPSG